MKQRSKKVIVFILAASFAFAILCATFAHPGQALAALSGCSQNSRSMVMTGCEHPHYLCGFDYTSNLLSPGAINSSRSNDTLKNVLGLALAAPSVDVSMALAPPKTREWKNVFPADPGGVSVRLFNSVLNL